MIQITETEQKTGMPKIKYLIILLAILLLSAILIPLFNAEGLRGNDASRMPSADGNIFFLLLNDNETISLNTYRNNRIVEVQTFSISRNSLFATDQEERVAILHVDKHIVIIYEFQTSKEIELYIPYTIKPKAILLNSDNLFIGGAMSEGVGEEMLVRYHIQSGEWYRLEVPYEIFRWGKAIDDLVVRDSLLIAIDNIVLPKYLLFYNLNSTGKLEFSHYEILPINAGNETIRQGRITSDYLGVLSRTSSWGGPFEHIAIYNCLDLTSSFAISIKAEQPCCNRLFPCTYTINDFLIVHDKVFLAHRSKGLGIFQIDDSYFESTDVPDLPQDVNPMRFNVRVDVDKVNYIQFRDEEIIHLTLIPNENKIVLTLRDALGRIRHEVFDV